MKRLSILFIIYIAMSSFSTQAAISISKGVKGGMNFTTFSNNLNFDYEWINGVTIGGYLGFEVLSTIALQAELIYSQKGASFDLQDSNTTIRINYIEIPILLKLRFPSPLFSYHLYAGPSLAFKMNEETEPQSVIIGDANYYDGSDFGVAFGVELALPILFKEASVDARYVFGTNNILKGSTPTNFTIGL